MELQPIVLTGRFVRLEPYAPDLKAQVGAALDCDAEGWSLVTRSGQGEHFDAWWDGFLADNLTGRHISYAVRRLEDGVVVGTTSYRDLRPHDRGVEIGATFLRPDVRSGPVNPDCKLIMLRHAFDAGALRVEIVTDARNRRSQAAIEKLGAVKEGVLRKHKVTWTGHVRDTVVYSITDEDWPAVRARLEARLAAY